MQLQHNLTELGLARLKLFQTFTLPSIEAQTNRNFLWTIRTDPDLVPEVMEPLLATLSNSSIWHRMVLLADNANPGLFRYHSRHVNRELVLGGNPDLLEHYLHMAVVPYKYTVETYLDADDAIPRDFVQRIQTEVKTHMVSPNDWVFWCSHLHYEWHVSYSEPPKKDKKPQKKSDNNNSTLVQEKDEPVNSTDHTPVARTSPYGYIRTLTDPRCLTAGMTMAYGINTTRRNLPEILKHHVIENQTRSCNENATSHDSHCTHQIYRDHPGALRARTPTSTGMTNVAIANTASANTSDPTSKEASREPPIEPEQLQLLQWIERDFGIQREAFRETRQLLVDRLARIAADNLRGQCTTGHSCKNSTKQLLQQLASVTNTPIRL